MKQQLLLPELKDEPSVPFQNLHLKSKIKPFRFQKLKQIIDPEFGLKHIFVGTQCMLLVVPDL